jgi:TonB family protein
VYPREPQNCGPSSLSSPLARCKLSRMNRAFLSVCTVTVTVASLFMIDQSLAQNAGGGDTKPDGVVLTELSRPSYPPLARQTRISGDVDLMLSIRPNGSLESAVVISGHPLLAQTALDSAQHTRFECRKCSETVNLGWYTRFNSRRIAPVLRRRMARRKVSQASKFPA